MTKEQTEPITLRIPPDLLAELDRLTRTRFVTRSDAIRSMLWQAIQREREQVGALARAGGEEAA
jgi:metal-responsive CopG/Arc/MetJ family transcriptional regulator